MSDGYATSFADMSVITASDVVVELTTTSAEYDAKKRILKVKTVSDGEPEAALTVEGFGVMSYNSRKREYSLTVRKLSANPGTVTVTSSLGGSDTISL